MFMQSFLSVYEINLQRGVTVRFQVVMVASMKVTVFWNIVPCSLVETVNFF
jgi:hypothetical protein